MQWTDRDVAMLLWINGHGFVEIKHIREKFFPNTNASNVYARLRELVKADCLIFEKIFHARPGVYRLSKQGAKLLGDALPPLRKVRLAQYDHDLLLVDLELYLCRHHEGVFQSERRVRHQRGLLAIGSSTHVCDGVWHQDDKKIALEVELSRKNRRRRQEIFDWYLRHFDYEQVWYFVGDARLKVSLEKYVIHEELSFVKIFDLKDMTDDVWQLKTHPILMA